MRRWRSGQWERVCAVRPYRRTGALTFTALAHTRRTAAVWRTAGCDGVELGVAFASCGGDESGGGAALECGADGVAGVVAVLESLFDLAAGQGCFVVDEDADYVVEGGVDLAVGAAASGDVEVSGDGVEADQGLRYVDVAAVCAEVAGDAA